MTTKYTTAETQHLIKVYKDNPNRTTVDMLSKEMGKTVKSIIGKLSREKVYQKIEYKTKRGEKPTTKLEMVGEIAEMLKGDSERLETLVKSSKQELLYLKVLVEDLMWDNENIS
jgi:MarR-like DNA-binding transcriptional regulator SgrR of sgrS sRNA